MIVLLRFSLKKKKLFVLRPETKFTQRTVVWGCGHASPWMHQQWQWDDWLESFDFSIINAYTNISIMHVSCFCHWCTSIFDSGWHAVHVGVFDCCSGRFVQKYSTLNSTTGMCEFCFMLDMFSGLGNGMYFYLNGHTKSYYLKTQCVGFSGISWWGCR